MDDIKKLFGKRLRELRKRKRMTQEKLAEMAGIEPRNLLKIENAQTFPRIKTLQKLMEALETSAAEIFSFEHHSNIKILRKKVMEALENDDDLVRLVYKIISP